MKNKDSKQVETKVLSIEDVMALLPTEKEAEQYANGYFGYESGTDEQERAFVSGVDWILCEIKRKLQGN